MPDYLSSVSPCPPAVVSHLSRSLRSAAGQIASAFAILSALAIGAPGVAPAQAKIATTTTLAVASGSTAVTTITSGATITLTATVTAGSTPVHTGQVNFCDASAAYCTDIHLFGVSQLTSSGAAVLKFRPGIGNHSYKAVFVGTNINAASSSSASPLTVTGTTGASFTTTTTLAATGTWGAYTMTAAVTEAGGVAAPSGTVSFLDTSNGNAVLATAPLGLGVPGLAWQNSQSPATGFEAEGVAVGDFNGDGIPDLAVTGFKDNSVTILLGNGDGTFTAAPAAASTGNGPNSIVVADFNGDGIQDLAIANYSVDSLTILLGKGDGTFTLVNDAPTTGTGPTSIAVADFNGDGIPDLAVSTVFSHTVTILLGKGDGTFTASTLSTNLVASEFAIAAGDFNGDGKADLAVTTFDGAKILLGNGDGTFTSGASYITAARNNYPISIAVADFNGDGKLDIAVGNGDNVEGSVSNLTILLGNGNGAFTQVPAGSSVPWYPSGIAVADFNQDGVPDIALTSSFGSGVAVLFGRGNGTFPTGLPVPAAGSGGVATGDFNGDGRVDLALPTGFGDTVAVMLSLPAITATVTPTAVSIPTAGQHIVAASYSGDSNYTPSISATTALWGTPATTKTTLAIASGGVPVTTVASGTVVTLTATVMAGATPLTPGQVEFCDATAPACTDIHLIGTAALTANGTAIVRFSPAPGQHSYKAVLIQSALGASSSSPALKLTVRPPAPVVAPTATAFTASGSVGAYILSATVVGTGSKSPLTGDVSFIDTSHSGREVATAKLGASTAGLAWPVSSSIPFSNIASLLFAEGDFNGDGIPDLAAINSNTKTVSILLGRGDGTFRNAPAITLSANTTAIVAGDFNGDGKLDLAVSMTSPSINSPSTLAILLGNGNGTFTVAPSAPTVDNSDNVFSAADFNGDGKLDLLVNDSTGTRILLGNGDGTFAQAQVIASLRTLAVADLNGDGLADLIVGANSGSLTVYLSKGDGTFKAAGPAFFTGTQFGSAVVGDFNRDGIADIAVADSFTGTISVLLGKGGGKFASTPIARLTVGDFVALALGDFNQDGKLDLAVASNYGDGAAIFLGDGKGSFAEASISPSVAASSVVVADFNRDGTSDLAVSTGSGISILLTEPTETATATTAPVAMAGPAPHMIDAVYAGDSAYRPSTSSKTSLDVQVAVPVFNPASGTYTTLRTVTITDATPGAVIYYSAQGNVQTKTWTRYTAPFTLGAEGYTSFQAYASERGYLQSTTASASYDMNFPPAPAPVITPNAGSYAGPQLVTITDAARGVPIYYTTDGSPPTTASKNYTGSFKVSASTIVAAMAAGNGYDNSAFSFVQLLIDTSASSLLYTVAGSTVPGYAGDGEPATEAMLNDPWMSAIDSAGNIYIADAGNAVVRKVDASTGLISTVAGTGQPGNSGNNGPATKAQFGWPGWVALDRFDNLYIADQDYGVVRKVDASTGIVTAFAGNPTATALGDNGPATNAQLPQPSGIALDASGNLYIGASSRIRMVNAATGIITTVVGTGALGYSGDNGPAISATLGQVTGLTLDGHGDIYFSDLILNVVRKVTASTGIITTVAGKYPSTFTTAIGDGGPATSAFLYYPEGVAVDVSGNLYIADSNNYEVRKVNASNGVIESVIGNVLYSCGEFGADGGPPGASGICGPAGITVDSSGRLFVAEAGGDRIRMITVSALPPTGKTAPPEFTAPAGAYAGPQTVNITSSTPGAAIYITLDGTVPTTHSSIFHAPLVVNGSIKISAISLAPGYLPSAPVTAAYTIAAPPPAVIRAFAGTGQYGSVKSGGAASSEGFGPLTGLAVDSAGNVYIPDQYHFVVWEVSPSTGIAKVVAGRLNFSGESGNGGPATSASLDFPSHVAIDAAGNLYIADSGSSLVRKVSAVTHIITAYAGGGAPGQLGDKGPATKAWLSDPQGLAVDAAGNLYIADLYNSRIRKVSPAGIITTFAGGSYGATIGDGGPATSATLSYPTDVALDSAGNLYIVDTDQARVRKVTAKTGIISTVAGRGAFGQSGDGALATLAELDPSAIAVDVSGNIYIANEPDTIRRVDAKTHIVSTVVGAGYFGSSGDGGSATLAELCYSGGIAVNKLGTLYLTDGCDNRVREVIAPGPAAKAALSLTREAQPDSAAPPASTPLPISRFAAPQSLARSRHRPHSAANLTFVGPQSQAPPSSPPEAAATTR